MADMNGADVCDHSRAVGDPDLEDDVVSFGLVNAVEVDGDTIRISFALGAPCPPAETNIGRRVREVLAEDGLEVDFTAKVLTDRDPDEEVLPGVRDIIAVASGKDGVGKSAIAVNLATGLSKFSACVGLFDTDIYGPNVPRMAAAEEAPQATQDQAIAPPERYGMKLTSMTFLVNSDDPVIRRSPMVHQLLTQLVRDVEWGSLDYLMLDLPPGTGDTQLSILQTLPLTGAIIVTTPQNIALGDANRGLWVFGKHGTNILSTVENMSTFRCPDCRDRHDIFSAGGSREFAASNDLPFLGALPLDPVTRKGGGGGKPIVLEDDDKTADAFHVMTENIADMVGIVQQRSVSKR